MSAKAKLFINGRSQAVRIPKALEFTGIDEVSIRKEGDALVITPARKNWVSFTALPKADDDFMQDRPELLVSDRVTL
ncbi:MAG: type II toxin-antitoxin system VapB family antitoxin [Gammaproteobacteria bacterium]|nr:MAG: type II toxin-antitoxin system VapB family antitoxin [Gammaproteobacteria bacterium]